MGGGGAVCTVFLSQDGGKGRAAPTEEGRAGCLCLCLPPWPSPVWLRMGCCRPWLRSHLGFSSPWSGKNSRAGTQRGQEEKLGSVGLLAPGPRDGCRPKGSQAASAAHRGLPGSDGQATETVSAPQPGLRSGPTSTGRQQERPHPRQEGSCMWASDIMEQREGRHLLGAHVAHLIVKFCL